MGRPAERRGSLVGSKTSHIAQVDKRSGSSCEGRSASAIAGHRGVAMAEESSDLTYTM